MCYVWGKLCKLPLVPRQARTGSLWMDGAESKNLMIGIGEGERGKGKRGKGLGMEIFFYV